MPDDIDRVEKYLNFCIAKEITAEFGNLNTHTKHSYKNFFNTLTSNKIKYLWVAGGGYSYIDFYDKLGEDVRRSKINISNPKVVIGFSDFTHMFGLLLEIPNLRVIYGPNFFEFINYHKISGKNNNDESYLLEKLDLIRSMFLSDIYFSSTLHAFFDDSRGVKITFSRVTGGLLTIFLGHSKLGIKIKQKIIGGNDGLLLIDLGIQKNWNSVYTQFISALRSFDSRELKAFRKIVLNYKIIGQFRPADEYKLLKLEMNKMLGGRLNRKRIILDIYDKEALDYNRYEGKTIVYPHDFTLLEFESKDSIMVFEDVGYNQIYLNNIFKKLIATLNALDRALKPKAIVFGSLLPLDTATPSEKENFYKEFTNLLKHLSKQTGIAVYQLNDKNISHGADSSFIPLGGNLKGTIENRVLEIRSQMNLNNNAKPCFSIVEITDASLFS